MAGDSFMAGPVGVSSGQLCAQGPPPRVRCVYLQELWVFLAHVACCVSVSAWAFAPVMDVTEDTDREQLHCLCGLAGVSLCVSASGGL